MLCYATLLAHPFFSCCTRLFYSKIVKTVKEKHPSVPLILYISGSGGLVEQMAATGADIVSLDWSVDMARGRQRMGSEVGVQGNLDPAVLFAPHNVIEEKVGVCVLGWGECYDCRCRFDWSVNRF